MGRRWARKNTEKNEITKKKVGRKWALAHFLKMGGKKKNGGGAHRFFDEKKSPTFLISLQVINSSIRHYSEEQKGLWARRVVLIRQFVLGNSIDTVVMAICCAKVQFCFEFLISSLK